MSVLYIFNVLPIRQATHFQNGVHQRSLMQLPKMTIFVILFFFSFMLSEIAMVFFPRIVSCGKLLSKIVAWFFYVFGGSLPFVFCFFSCCLVDALLNTCGITAEVLRCLSILSCIFSMFALDDALLYHTLTSGGALHIDCHSSWFSVWLTHSLQQHNDVR